MRIRSVKPEFWKDERMVDLPRDARLVYIALWCEADDEGRFRSRMDYLHGSLFPCDPGQWFDEAYRALLDSKRVIEYEADGLHYAYIPRFKDHQKPNKPTRSRLPPPPNEDATVGLPEPSRMATTPLPPGAREQGRGVVYEGEGEERDPAPSASPSEQPQEPDPGEQVAKKRTKEKKAKEDYISGLLPVMEKCYHDAHGMVLSAKNGIRRQVIGHLVAVAKSDGYKTVAANTAEVERILASYFADQEPFVADGKHPITLLLTSRLDRYRRPLAVPTQGCTDA